MPRAFAKAPLPAVFLLALIAPASSQQQTELKTLTPLQPGITIPVALQHSLRAGKDPIGTRIVARTTQRVPIAPGLYLKRGAEVVGEVSASTSGNTASQPNTLSLRFTGLRYQNYTVELHSDAIAIANFTDVGDTAAPAAGGPDRGNPDAANWTTRQVGGDEVYRSGWVGDVYNNVMRKVGSADFDGVYRDPPSPRPGQDLDFPLALGVFSASATGLYGFDPDITLHSVNGTITLTSPSHKLFLHGGDNLLLEVIAPPTPPK